MVFKRHHERHTVLAASRFHLVCVVVFLFFDLVVWFGGGVQLLSQKECDAKENRSWFVFLFFSSKGQNVMIL